MWIIRSFRRDEIQYVTKWKSRVRCYMGLMCWAIGMNDLYSFTSVILKYGLVGVVPISVIFLVLIVPIGYMELAIGQFSKCAYINVWNLSPPFKGIGYTCVYMLSLSSMHSNLVSVLLLYYIRGSVQSPVPWFSCSGKWAKANCYVTGQENKKLSDCRNKMSGNKTIRCDQIQWEDSAQHYWTEVVTVESTILSSSQHSLDRIMFSAITALLVFIMLRKGVSTVEVFIPILCVMPHMLQLVLFAVALMLPGAREAAFKFYLPKLYHLGDGHCWDEVMRLVLTGTNVGLGGNILFGSESGDFRTPIHMAAIVIYFSNFLLNTLFALFCCTTVAAYSYYSSISLERLTETHDVAYFIKDMSIAFLPWPWLPQIWTVMYFLSLYTVTIRTKVLVLHAFISGIYHIFPELVHYYDMCAFTVIILDFWISLSYFNSYGIRNLFTRATIFNNTCILIVLVYESVVIMYVYGTPNLMDDIHFMLGFRHSAYWQLCWYLCPLVAITIFGLSCQEWLRHFTYIYEQDQTWIFILVIVSVAVCLTLTPAYMVAYLLRHRRKKKWYKLMKPSPQWGPADPRLRKSREMFAAHSMTKEYIYRQQRQSRQLV